MQSYRKIQKIFIISKLAKLYPQWCPQFQTMKMKIVFYNWAEPSIWGASLSHPQSCSSITNLITHIKKIAISWLKNTLVLLILSRRADWRLMRVRMLKRRVTIHRSVLSDNWSLRKGSKIRCYSVLMHLSQDKAMVERSTWRGNQ
jgi:hypothetical protein